MNEVAKALLSALFAINGHKASNQFFGCQFETDVRDAFKTTLGEIDQTLKNLMSHNFRCRIYSAQ